MTQIVARLFTNAANAAAAAQDVRAYRFGDNEVHTIDAAAGGAHDDLAARIAQAGVARDEAPTYAQQVADGATLIVVHAPFGSARKATVLLDRHQPLPSPVPVATPAPIRYDKATPLSSLYQWPTLLNNPSPFSSFWNLPVLSRFSLSQRWGYGELSGDAAPLSKRFGWNALLDDPTPLSTRLKWPVVKESERTRKTPLINNPSPLSSWLKIPVLSRR